MHAEISFPLSARSTAVRITVLYVIGSALWIVLSDSILHGVIRGAPPVLWRLETLKGLVYVAVSGILLGLVTYDFQQRQEQARLVTESKLRKLREAGLIGIFSYDNTGTVRQANDAFLAIIGYSKQDLKENRICLTDFTAPEYLADRQVASRRLSSIFEEELVRKDGTRVPVIGGWGPMDDDGGEGIGYILDISDRRKAEAEKDALQLQLAQSEKLNALGQLAAGVAHDFNNLLNIIIGYATLAQNTAEDPESVRQNTDHAISAAIDATGLIRQLLAFGRKQVLHCEALDLTGLVEHHCQMLQRLLGENIRISLKPGPPVWVVADPVQLEQVLMNLIINARDAIEGTGIITISTAYLTIKETTNNVAAGEYAVLTVRDTGKGMGPGILARIFEPFFTTKERQGGTGLGLSTTYGIVKQSNGHIWVESTPGQGTTFTILLPRGEQTSIRFQPRTEKRQHSVVSGTILLVEDSSELRELFAAILERAGFRVLQANDGVEAIRISKGFSGRIDLIISDVVMPNLNGPEAVTEVLKERPMTRVIFMSGYTDPDTPAKGGLVIEKPVAPDALIASVREALAA